MRRIVSGLKCPAQVSSSIPEYFALFGFEPRFAIDREHLKKAYREVLSQVHPDRHAGANASDADRRAAMQLATHANEAFQVLRTDSTRAAYLCRCHGIALDGPTAALPGAFLEQQMAWREALQQASADRDGAALADISRESALLRASLLARIAQAIDERADYAEAAVAVRSLMFLDKLDSQIDQLAAEWDLPLVASR